MIREALFLESSRVDPPLPEHRETGSDVEWFTSRMLSAQAVLSLHVLAPENVRSSSSSRCPARLSCHGRQTRPCSNHSSANRIGAGFCLAQQHCSSHVSGITPFAGGYRPTFFSVAPAKKSRSQDTVRRLQTPLARDNDASNGTHFW